MIANSNMAGLLAFQNVEKGNYDPLSKDLAMYFAVMKVWAG